MGENASGVLWHIKLGLTSFEKVRRAFVPGCSTASRHSAITVTPMRYPRLAWKQLRFMPLSCLRRPACPPNQV